MTNLSEKMRPMDLIAIIIICGCFITALVMNVRPESSPILGIIVGYYFGKATSKRSHVETYQKPGADH